MQSAPELIEEEEKRIEESELQGHEKRLGSGVKFRSKPAHIWILLGVITSFILIISLFYGADALASYDWRSLVGPRFWLFVLAGFIAQMIDGSRGMA